MDEIAFPKNNEAEFVELASKLGFKKIYFIYDFDAYLRENIKEKLNSIRNDKNLDIEAGFTSFVTKSSDKDRFFIESKKIKLIYGFEELQKKDYLHQRSSGLNHIMCELANKNDVAVGLSYSSLFNKNNLIAPLLMGRMMQNISLCKKYKVKTVIGSFSQNPFDMRSPHDIKSLFTVLGMGSRNLIDSLNYGSIIHETFK